MSKVIDPLTDEQLEEWAQALESGKYEQGSGALCRDGAYCCLGVLAESRGEIKEEIFTRPRLNDGGLLNNDCLSRWYYLSEATQRYLANQNDDNLTFPEIATYIRENLIGGSK